MLLTSTAIVHITGKANKLRSQNLKSLHFAQENETENHALPLPPWPKNLIMNCCLKLISILCE